MPRDVLPPPDVEISLPGGRRGRLVAGEAAGQFRVALHGHDWVSRLAAVGWLSRDQFEAAGRLHELFDQSGIRPRVGGSYQVRIDYFSLDFMLEAMDEAETTAWRKLGRLLGACSLHTRTQVETVCCWDLPPSSLKALQDGLSAVATAIREPRRRR